MSDDSLHPDPELASAALDGELTEQDHATAQGDPDVQELLDTYRRVQHAVRDVPPVQATDRDRAVAAALAAFDAADDGTDGVAADAPTEATNVRQLTHRRWQRALLGASAAAAIALVVGIAVNLSRHSDDGRQATTAVAGDASKGSPEAPPFSTPRPTIGNIDGPGSVVQVINSPAELAALGGAPPIAANSTPLAPQPADSIATDSGGGGGTEGVAVPCSGANARYLADIVYQGVPAVAVIDDATGVVRALDPANVCAVLAEAP